MPYNRAVVAAPSETATRDRRQPSRHPSPATAPLCWSACDGHWPVASTPWVWRLHCGHRSARSAVTPCCSTRPDHTSRNAQAGPRSQTRARTVTACHAGGWKCDGSSDGAATVTTIPGARSRSRCWKTRQTGQGARTTHGTAKGSHTLTHDDGKGALSCVRTCVTADRAADTATDCPACRHETDPARAPTVESSMDENVAMAAVSPARATAPHWTMYTARSHGQSHTPTGERRRLGFTSHVRCTESAAAKRILE